MHKNNYDMTLVIGKKYTGVDYAQSVIRDCFRVANSYWRIISFSFLLRRRGWTASTWTPL